jgi:YfiH family protein
MLDTRLPQPNDSFRWAQVAARPALACGALEPIAHHLFTTREWELGSGLPGSDDRGWRQVADALGVELVRAQQVHGTAVVVRRAGDAPFPTLPHADIVVSNDPSVAIAVQAADCVPILIADRRTGVVAAAHAGWRGLAAGVPRIAIEALTREFGSRPADLVAAAGPSISACCYEVGADVRGRFEDGGWSGSKIAGWFFAQPQPTIGNPSMAGVRSEPRSGHWYFDSGRAACDQLESAGVPRNQIYGAALCTASHPGALCSYRRDGTGAGRLAAAIRPRGRALAT